MSVTPSTGQRRSKKGAKKRPNHASDRIRPCPISRLHDDILWLIFTLNTVDDAEFIDQMKYGSPKSSLLTVKYTSQVCARWRALILASSSIWASSLDLKFLDQTSDHWRHEILKRTGSSTLSVQGDVDAKSPRTSFFFSLLDDHWPRLRRMSIWVRDKGISNDERWLSMRRPAPNLEIISVIFPSCPAFSTADKILFSNNAPSIHTISLHHMALKLSGAWLSRVRHLRLSNCSVGRKILHALAEMSSLETLAMAHMDSSLEDIGAGNSHLPTVILPRLKSLNLAVRFETLIHLLGHIAPTPGCSLELGTNVPTDIVLSARDRSLLQRAFAAHFRCFSAFKPNETFSWIMTTRAFFVRNLLEDDHDWPRPFSFSLSIMIYTDSWNEIPYIILNALHSCDLSSIKTLEQDISRAALDPSNSNLVKFYQALNSVETMHLDSQTIEILLKVEEHTDGPILFPRLQTIVFNTDATLKSDVIMQFLSRRRDAGAPVKLFDLSRCGFSEGERLVLMDGMDGLEVKWVRRLDRCGRAV